jgi:hypothetical protein
MINKIKENKKLIERIAIISVIVLISFYIIYKLSSSLFMVITGSIILLIGALVKDPELSNAENKEYSKLEQLTIFSDEVLEPSIALSDVKKEIEKQSSLVVEKEIELDKNMQVIDIENTNSYKFDELDKKIKKSKKVKA